MKLRGDRFAPIAIAVGWLIVGSAASLGIGGIRTLTSLAKRSGYSSAGSDYSAPRKKLHAFAKEINTKGQSTQ